MTSINEVGGTQSERQPQQIQSGGSSSSSIQGMDPVLTRRDFLGKATVAAGAVGLGVTGAFSAEPAAEPRFPLVGFSKPFQKLGPVETAALVAEVGWDGIEIPVRTKGQIEPERAPDELPKFTEVLRRQKGDVHVVTTEITSMKTPHAETVLRAMATLGLKRLRLGHFNYVADKSPTERLKEITPALKDIAAACKDLGLQAGFQNHSGRQYIGAPVWDAFSLIRELDPRHIGFCFDIGHATVEGGLSWSVEARLAEPFLTAVYVKDFYWKKVGGAWKDTWCPLGEGMVNRGFFDWLKKSSYRGPICQHHEYEVGDGPRRIASFQQDLKVLKAWLA